MPVFLPVEVLSRELESRLLIASYLVRHGVTTFIGAPSMCEEVAIKLRKGVLLHNRMTAGDIPLFRRLRQAGVSCVAIDEEALNLSGMWTEVVRTNPEGINVDLLDWAFCSTEAEYRAFLELFPHQSHKIRLVGNPRIEVQSPLFSSFWRAHRPRMVPARDFVLIATNFSYGNLAKSYGMSPKTHRTRILENADYEVSAKEESLRKLESIVDYEKTLFGEYTRAIKKLAASFPDLKFVVRPHPSEEARAWRQGLKKIDNVLVSRSGAVGSWLSSATAAIHAGSTISMEADARGTPLLYFLPTDGNPAALRGVSDYPEHYGSLCTNVEEVQEELRRILSAKTERNSSRAESRDSHRAESARLISHYILKSLEGRGKDGLTVRVVAIALTHGILRELSSLGRVLLSRLTKIAGTEADIGSSYEKFGFHSPIYFRKKSATLDSLVHPLGRRVPKFLPLGPRLFVLSPKN